MCFKFGKCVIFSQSDIYSKDKCQDFHPLVQIMHYLETALLYLLTSRVKEIHRSKALRWLPFGRCMRFVMGTGATGQSRQTKANAVFSYIVFNMDIYKSIIPAHFKFGISFLTCVWKECKSQNFDIWSLKFTKTFPVFCQKIKKRTDIKILRQLSVHMDVTYIYYNLAQRALSSKLDIHSKDICERMRISIKGYLGTIVELCLSVWAFMIILVRGVLS